MKLRTTLRRTALLAGALTLSLSAVAAPTVEQVPAFATRTVKYNPAEATTPAGAAKLYGSLRQAAGTVCREPQTRSGTLDTGFSTCRESAVGRAVDAIAIPTVSALHSQSGRKTAP